MYLIYLKIELQKGTTLIDKLDSLERLQRLRDSGALNSEEFLVQKSLILNRVDDAPLISSSEVHSVTRDDIATHNAIRGRRRFSFISTISIIFMFLIFAIQNDFYGKQYGYYSSIFIYVFAIIIVSLFVDFVYRYVPVISIFLVSVIFSFIVFSIANLIFGIVLAFLFGAVGFLYAAIHSYRGSKYYADQPTGL
jgi:cellulose synthase/poly-beta-1,6-N-acetylglucosamine synthase-like glycosyltransferase